MQSSVATHKRKDRNFTKLGLRKAMKQTNKKLLQQVAVISNPEDVTESNFQSAT